jgi:hypothetical protein
MGPYPTASPYPMASAYPMAVPGRPIQDEPDEPVSSSVVIISTQPTKEKEVSMAAELIKGAEKAAASEAAKVEVRSPFRVVHEGEPFAGGDVVEVPNATAQTWIRAGWAEPVPKRGK